MTTERLMVVRCDHPECDEALITKEMVSFQPAYEEAVAVGWVTFIRGCTRSGGQGVAEHEGDEQSDHKHVVDDRTGQPRPW